MTLYTIKSGSIDLRSITLDSEIFLEKLGEGIKKDIPNRYMDYPRMFLSYNTEFIFINVVHDNCFFPFDRVDAINKRLRFFYNWKYIIYFLFN